jgi:hypothetical protein
MIKHFFLFAVAFSLMMCGSDTASSTEGKTMDGDKMNKTEQKNRKTPNKYSISPFPSSPGFEDAKISNMQYDNGTFSFKVEGDDYKLGAQTPDAPQKMCANSAKGQHIHMIIDNAPYLAKYTSTFEAEMADGEYHTLAFLSRSYHESIKTDQANIAMKVKVKGGKITEAEEIKMPMLFYSRPKGTYVGERDTKKVMLDFYLKNVDLGSNFMVKADINGEIHMLDKWTPYFIEGLPMGENTIELTLVDKKGNTIQTPLNPVKRTFTLSADPAEKK